MPKYYAIKRPDGSWIMTRPQANAGATWAEASWHDTALSDIRRPYWPDGDFSEAATSAGYRCCEVSGFVEVGK